jgi:L-lactate utilization protein LutC
MTTDSHDKGMSKNPDKIKENAKVNDIEMKKMSQEELDQEISQMKETLNIMKMMLQESERHQSYGWRMKKKVAWHVKKLFARKMKKKVRCVIIVSSQEELRETNLEDEVHICEPE